MPDPSVSGPLNGVRILDLTHVWAGPLAVRFLSDLGAEVVRIEAPDSRGPREYSIDPIGGWLGGEHGDEPWNDNAAFVKLMRNRRSLCLDLKTDTGRTTFLNLVEHADVVMENFSARAMPSLNLGYDVLRQANPSIICVSMPGYGASGPLRDRVAYGPTVEVMSGFTAMMGYGPDEPRNTAMALMDPVTGTHAAAAVLTALRKRDAEGLGLRVEISLHEGGVTYNGPWLVDEQRGQAPHCIGNRHPEMAPHGIYRCAGDDEWIAIACADDEEWLNLCRVVPGLDAKMTVDERHAAEDGIGTTVFEWTSLRNKHEAAQELQNAGVSAGPVNNVPDMNADPQVKAREFFALFERYDVPMPGNPIKMEGLDQNQWTRCPRLGEDNASVLKDWLGMEDAAIADLAAQNVIAEKPPA